MCVCRYILYISYIHQTIFSHFIFILLIHLSYSLECPVYWIPKMKFGGVASWQQARGSWRTDCSLLLNTGSYQCPRFYFDSVNPEAASKLEPNLNSSRCFHPHPDSVHLPACQRTTSCQTDDRLNLSRQRAFPRRSLEYGLSEPVSHSVRC